MNIMRKFSVRPKVDGANHSSSKVYPVLYVISVDNTEFYGCYFGFRGDSGVLDELKAYDATIEDVEL